MTRQKYLHAQKINMRRIGGFGMRERVIVITMVLFMFAAATVLVYMNFWHQNSGEYKDGILIEREWGMTA